jgi:hypothetical protein
LKIRSIPLDIREHRLQRGQIPMHIRDQRNPLQPHELILTPPPGHLLTGVLQGEVGEEVTTG